MAPELISEIDEITGLPLPILPTEPPKGARFGYTNFHHHFHPARDPELQGIAGEAVRMCRGQTIVRVLHQRYHDLFIGPELPTTDEDKFRVCVLACAGVVPPQALDLSVPGEYQVVNLSMRQMKSLVSSRSIHIEKAHRPERDTRPVRDKIGRFFAEYLVSRGVQLELPERRIEQFLDPRTRPRKRRRIGNAILEATLDISIQDIEELHKELILEGYAVNRPAQSPSAVVNYFFPKEQYPEYHDSLALHLRAA